MTNKERALLVADKAHFNQMYDIYPYGYHIRQVAKIAENLGYDESIIVSCVLHDILEDTGFSYNDLKKAFGEEISEIVYCVTDEIGRNRNERKIKTYPKIRGNWKSTVVKICDRIANIQHSRLYNQKLFKMYKNENDIFVENLTSNNHPYLEINKAWAELNKVMSIFD